MKGHLLLVDDEPTLLETMRELLECEGLTVSTALNGQEALRLLQKEKFDCVVSDVRMPVMDGITFLRHARHEGLEMPFIFYSGHACEHLAKEVRAYGGQDLLAKPDFMGLEKSIFERLQESNVSRALLA